VPQATTSKKEVDSSQVLVWRFCQRRLTATAKVAVAWPVGVKRQLGVLGQVPDDGEVAGHGWLLPFVFRFVVRVVVEVR
jgi:hypothetical protein